MTAVMVIATSGVRLDMGGKRGIKTSHRVGTGSSHYGMHDQRDKSQVLGELRSPMSGA